MKTLNYIGLEASGATKTASELQQLLADLHVFYMNLRGFHWHIEGKGFFALHEMFEKLYDSVGDKIDDVAERILTLGNSPESRFSEYLKKANIKEDGVSASSETTIKQTLDNLKTIITQMQKVSKVAENNDDSVTQGIMDEYIQEYQKTIWMLVATLK